MNNYLQRWLVEECGKIVWESKYTKAFSGGWIDKLKSDQQEAEAKIKSKGKKAKIKIKESAMERMEITRSGDASATLKDGQGVDV